MATEDNPGKGARFEEEVREFFRGQGLNLSKKYSLDIGFGGRNKAHKFDLGQDNPQVLVECKRHTWTESGNTPSAKMSVWNEAMLYFLAAPQAPRKILCVKRTVRREETLAEYYVRLHGHLIPPGIEIWEYDDESNQGARVFPI